MKDFSRVMLIAALVPVGFLVNACSNILIQNPTKNEQIISTPYTLVVKHTGCGTVKPETFKAWLDKGSNTSQEITSDFSYSLNTWTSTDYSLSMGNHTLSVGADVIAGGWCYTAKNADTRTFFVAPCTDFVTALGRDFELAPNILTIEFGTTVISITQGEEKSINIPDESPLIVNGKLPATVKYSIRNKTTKNLKFRVLMKHGDAILYYKDLIFCGEGIVNEQQLVNFSSDNNLLDLTIEAGDIINEPGSDDTRPIFFNGKLMVRFYPL